MTEKQLEQKIQELEIRNSQLEKDISILGSSSHNLDPESILSEDEIDLGELWQAIWQGKWEAYSKLETVAVKLPSSNPAPRIQDPAPSQRPAHNSKQSVLET